MSKYKFLSVARIMMIALPALILSGCGGPGNIGKVSGTVTLDSQPLADAVVQFQPGKGAPSAGITDSSGHYTLRYSRQYEGAEIGDHTVRITTFKSGDEDADPPRKAIPERLPNRYNSKTELTAAVKAGSNTFDFPLESKGEITQPKMDE